MRKILIAFILTALMTFTACLGEVDDPYAAPSGYNDGSSSSEMQSRVMADESALSSASSFESQKSRTGLGIQSGPKPYSMKSAQDTANFSVSVKGGTAPYTYKWSVCYNKTPAETFPETSDKQTCSFSHTFSDHDFDLHPEISVVCTVTDASGDSVTSSHAKVTQCINILSGIRNYSLTSLEDTPEFTVKIYGGTAPYTYNWYTSDTVKKTLILSETKSEQSNTLKFKVTSEDLSKLDIMQIMCTVTDSLGFSVSTDMVQIENNIK